MEYTWKVTGLKVKDAINLQGEVLSSAVVQTYWEKTGTDQNGISATFVGATPFSAENVPAGEFVAFETLTEETVLNWIQTVVTGPYEEHVNSRIQRQIDAQTIKNVDILPWT